MKKIILVHEFLFNILITYIKLRLRFSLFQNVQTRFCSINTYKVTNHETEGSQIRKISVLQLALSKLHIEMHILFLKL